MGDCSSWIEDDDSGADNIATVSGGSGVMQLFMMVKLVFVVNSFYVPWGGRDNNNETARAGCLCMSSKRVNEDVCQ